LAAAREKLKARLLRRGIAPAILPAMDLPPLIHGGLTSATMRAVVANSATPGVIDLCDGVLRAMILSKLKLTTAVVLTVGMIGGGAGWMALTPGGPGVALAGPQAKADGQRPETAQELQRRMEEETEKQQVRVDMLRIELAKAHDQMAIQEETWARERIEERYNQLEKRLARYAAPEDDQVVQVTLRQIAELRLKMTEAAKKSGKGEKDPQIEAWRSEIKEVEGKLKADRVPYDTLRSDVRDARSLMVAAEEQLSLLGRLTALKRRAAQTQIEDLQDRLNQLRGGSGRADPVERKVKDLDRKLDDVLRELTELRRELKK
jgi:hypothetical protein